MLVVGAVGAYFLVPLFAAIVNANLKYFIGGGVVVVAVYLSMYLIYLFTCEAKITSNEKVEKPAKQKAKKSKKEKYDPTLDFENADENKEDSGSSRERTRKTRQADGFNES